MNQTRIETAYELAREQYAELGIDTDLASDRLASVALSLHCWQGDDVGGFESPDAALSGGGLAVTGNYPGKARTLDELRHDLAHAFSLIPGSHRLNLHAIYGDFAGQKTDRDAIGPEHFQSWIDWAKEQRIKLDFNATLFSHPLAEQGLTLSHPDANIRRFWIEHVKRCRRIGAAMGEALESSCVHNLWIPDGTKNDTTDRAAYRQRLWESLCEIYADSPSGRLLDSVESKLFGIGSESFVVGSHEFYLGFAQKHGLMPCLDMGHYHPTESVAEKISALMPVFEQLLIHVSRGVRWDSDHVVHFTDDVRALMLEITRAQALERVHLALDYFDASLNRVGAWVIGARATLKALLFALLEPAETLRKLEAANDGFGCMALTERMKSLPFGAVWDWYCVKAGVPVGAEWIAAVHAYENEVLNKRN